MENEKLFTIVIPIYNVERYLRQCLNSVLYQTINNHIVVMVNDGSTDSSGEIAKEYAKKYPEMFKYYEEKNAGLGAARNEGMRHVNTQFISFLDSDDWLVPRFIERVTQKINDDGNIPDLIYTLPCIYDMATGLYQDWMDKPLYNEIFYSNNAVVNPKQDPRIFGLEPNANRKIYRTDFLRKNGFAFPESTKWEDVEPHFQLLHIANRCVAEKSVGFVYRINSGNQITTSVGKGRLQVVSVFSRALKKATEEEWPSIEVSYILKMLFSFAKWCISFSTNEVRKELVQELHNLFLSISKPDLDRYYCDFNVSKKDREYIRLLRSPFYSIIGKPVQYDNARFALKRLMTKLRK